MFTFLRSAFPHSSFFPHSGESRNPELLKCNQQYALLSNKRHSIPLVGEKFILPSGIRLVIITLLLLCYQLSTVRVAFAHADLAGSEPAPDSILSEPPERVTLYFTETVEPGFSEIRVLDARGSQVDNRDISRDKNNAAALSVTLPELSRGLYTVVWRNISAADGHAVQGSFIFSIGEPVLGTIKAADGAVPGARKAAEAVHPLLQSPAEPFLKWLLLLSLLALAGGIGFELLVWRPVLMRRDSSKPVRMVAAGLASRVLNLYWLSMGVFLSVSIVQLLVQTAIARDIPFHKAIGAPAISLLTSTAWGHLWALRTVLLLGIVALLDAPPAFSKIKLDNSINKVIPWPRLLFALVLSCGMLLMVSLVSHSAAATGIKSEALFSDYTHLLAAAFWVGGLFHFALAFPVFVRHLSRKEQHLALSHLAPRFSILATLSVGALIITGLYSSWVQVSVVRALTTPYGLTLLIKVLLIVPLFLLGALNKRWTGRKLRSDENTGKLMRRLITVEALLAALVLLSAGFLTSLEPARQAFAKVAGSRQVPISFHETTENSHITLLIEPGRVGLNKVQVYLQDISGRAITNASGVILRLKHLDRDLGENTVSAMPAVPGYYTVENVPLSVAGAWQADLLVMRPDAFDTRTTFRFNTVPVGITVKEVITPSPRTGKILWVVEVVLLAFLFLGVWFSSRISGMN